MEPAPAKMNDPLEITDEQGSSFTVVGLAASAGGLEALSLLSQNLTDDANCCYVIAQHMSPKHKSMLVQLLSRETQLSVYEIEQDLTPEPGVIYIPPPGFDVVYKDNALQLRQPAGHHSSPKPSADRLFFSLAEALNQRAVGVVLSGTGRDGSYGVRAIREQGGITIAQDPETCKYAHMPEAAIKTGCIDLVLTPQQIGEHIEHMLMEPRNLSMLHDLSDDRSQNRDLMGLLLSQTSVDFRGYKQTTVNRRIKRRMLVNKLESMDDYIELCRGSSVEIDALFRDLLISVTRFFRDKEQFAALSAELGKRFEGRDLNNPIRIWVPGCATGEEAYSIAITICEIFGGLSEIKEGQLHIFATDIDEAAMAHARKGIYPVSALVDVSPNYYDEYFDVGAELVTVKRKLRSFVKFRRHNVFQDAPFSNIDLVSIRNVLIYFNPKLQERVLTRVLFALNDGGQLFLGTAETLGDLENSFSQVSSSAKLFARRISSKGFSDRSHLVQAPDSIPVRQERGADQVDSSFDEWRFFDVLARSIGKAGVLINRDRLILRVYGDLTPFSQVTERTLGRASLEILRKPLAADAASLALVALKIGEVRRGTLHDIPGDAQEMVQITAYPVQSVSVMTDELVLLSFDFVEKVVASPDSGDGTEYSTYLEEELSRTRNALQVSSEQLQTSNEELQTVNEELQSTNEELQSANEELETSNEELQSTNEELITVNEELLVNATQLEKVSAEMDGLIRTLPSVVVMLDRGLLVTYASDAAIKLFHLADLGPGYGHISQINLPEGFPSLVTICGNALLERSSETVRFDDGTHFYELRIAPVDDQNRQLVGLVLQILSIDQKVLPSPDRDG